MTLDLMVLSANMRRVLSDDRGSVAWSERKVRLVQMLRRHNPDVVMAQECDETMTPYIAEKTGMCVYKPTAGNRPIFYRNILNLIDQKWTDLGNGSYAHAALLQHGDSHAWFVTAHLEAHDSGIRKVQQRNLAGWIETLTGPVVIGADMSTENDVTLPHMIDVRSRVKIVTNRLLASRHTWLVKHRRGPWVDRMLTTAAVHIRWVSLILTDRNESDHHFIGAGITI